MACERWRTWQARLARGAGSESAAQAWARHAASCPDCRAAAAWDELMGEALKRLKAPPASPGFNARVWARIAEGPLPERRRVWWPVAAGGLTVAAAAAAAVLVLVHPLESPRTPETVKLAMERPAAGPVKQAEPPGPAPDLTPFTTRRPGPGSLPRPEHAVLPPEGPRAEGPEVAAIAEVGGTGAAVQPPAPNGGVVFPAPKAPLAAAGAGPTSYGAAAGTPVIGEVRLAPNKLNLSRGDRARLEMNLSRDTFVTAILYTRTGERVRVLQEGELAAGVHTLEWDGRTDEGTLAASGIYLLVVGGGVPEKHLKIAVIK